MALLREQVAALEEANVDLQQQLAWSESEMSAQQETIERLENQIEGRRSEEEKNNVRKENTSKDILKRLREGATFIKHTRRGSPHPRVVWVDNNMENICWQLSSAKNYIRVSTF